MKALKRFILLVLAVICIALPLTSCGDSDSSSNKDKLEDTWHIYATRYNTSSDEVNVLALGSIHKDIEIKDHDHALAADGNSDSGYATMHVGGTYGTDYKIKYYIDNMDVVGIKVVPWEMSFKVTWYSNDIFAIYQYVGGNGPTYDKNDFALCVRDGVNYYESDDTSKYSIDTVNNTKIEKNAEGERYLLFSETTDFSEVAYKYIVLFQTEELLITYSTSGKKIISYSKV